MMKAMINKLELELNEYNNAIAALEDSIVLSKLSHTSISIEQESELYSLRQQQKRCCKRLEACYATLKWSKESVYGKEYIHCAK